MPESKEFRKEFEYYKENNKNKLPILRNNIETIRLDLIEELNNLDKLIDEIDCLL